MASTIRSSRSPSRIMKNSAGSHRAWRVKRETCAKGATWADWISASSRLSRQSRSAILQECSPVVLDVRTIEFLPCLIIFPQPARRRLARRLRWGPNAGAPHVRIGGAGEGNPSFLLHQLSKDAGGRPTPMAWRSTACSSSRLYGLVR